MFGTSLLIHRAPVGCNILHTLALVSDRSSGPGQVIRIIYPSIDLRQLVTGGFGYILGKTGTAVRRSASESEAVSTAKRWLATGQNWLGQTPK